jgi:hypothetical protein
MNYASSQFLLEDVPSCLDPSGSETLPATSVASLPAAGKFCLGD